MEILPLLSPTKTIRTELMVWDLSVSKLDSLSVIISPWTKTSKLITNMQWSSGLESTMYPARALDWAYIKESTASFLPSFYNVETVISYPKANSTLTWRLFPRGLLPRIQKQAHSYHDQEVVCRNLDKKGHVSSSEANPKLFLLRPESAMRKFGCGYKIDVKMRCGRLAHSSVVYSDPSVSFTWPFRCLTLLCGPSMFASAPRKYEQASSCPPPLYFSSSELCLLLLREHVPFSAGMWTNLRLSSSLSLQHCQTIFSSKMPGNHDSWRLLLLGGAGL
jgi:hypothetical protein